MQLFLLYETLDPGSEEYWLDLVTEYLKRDKGRGKLSIASFLRKVTGEISISSVKTFRSKLEELADAAWERIKQEEEKIAQRKKEKRETRKTKRKEKATHRKDPTHEIKELLRQDGAALVRSKGHTRVFRLSNGKMFSLSKTPSDYRSRWNELSRLRNLLSEHYFSSVQRRVINESDIERRLAQRRAVTGGESDQTRRLKEELRAGAITRDQVDLLTYLNYQPAVDLQLPGSPSPIYENFGYYLRGLENWGSEVIARASMAIARLVIPLYESKTGDVRLRKWFEGAIKGQDPPYGRADFLMATEPVIGKESSMVYATWYAIRAIFRHREGTTDGFLIASVGHYALLMGLTEAQIIQAIRNEMIKWILG